MAQTQVIFDAHSHLPGGTGLPGLYVASKLPDCEILLRTAQERPEVFPAFGIHPWDSDKITFEQILPYLEDGVAVGEIGLDSVWTDVPLPIQREIFIKQLEWAQHHERLVVLHTKGCEREVLDIIQGFDLSYLVHWYSCEEYIAQYAALGCRFTIGPDLRTNKAVQKVAATVPLEKLCVESDGIGGISWALGRNVLADEIPDILAENWKLVTNRAWG